MRTPERIARMERVLGLRQLDLRVVLEHVANPHNANAVLRTCDAAGLLHVDVIGSDRHPLPINNAVTTKADKWLTLHYHPSTAACLEHLKGRGFRIAATHLGADAVPYTQVDWTKPTAVIFGGEKVGISSDGLALADVRIKIPMLGMAQSLNLSVSVGIILYEAIRQRREAETIERPRLSPEEFKEYLDRWSEI